jgi:glycosyltransferase involved in cell wall biosynthesis
LKNDLSIILIAHNEEQTIGLMLEGLLATYDREILEIIVVDDASKDNTAGIVASWMKRAPKVRLVKRTPPIGVGRALKTGFSNISPKAEYALSMDSDFVENIGQVGALLKAIQEEDCDVVIGSRFVEGGKLVGYPFFKRVMNRLFHGIVKMLFNIKQNDLSNNFKLYKANVLGAMPWKSDGFAMNAETGLWPVLFGYKVVEVPVIWANRNPQMGKSKFGLLRQSGGYIQVIYHALRLARSVKNKHH